MPLTRLDNLISSKTGRYLYVSPDDFNASDELDNRGNSPNRPFKTIQRAFLEVARYSYLPGIDNDRFDEFTIMLMPGDHYIDNRPGKISNSNTPVFSFDQLNNAWTDSSVLDLSNPNNVLYQFNGTDGGCVVPRGCSLVGYDLRRTIIRPLYVPDPADKEQPRTSMFNVTGGAYIWQFTIKDGDLTTKSPLYDSNDGVGKVYYRKNDSANLAIPEYSHHKITVFEYAQKSELELYYTKIAKAFSQYQPTIDDLNEFGPKIQETRIVGPLSDLRSIQSLKVTDSAPVGTVTVEVTTKIAHGYIVGQYFAVQENGLDDALNGTFDVVEIDPINRRKFKFEVATTVSALGLQNNQTYSAGNGLSNTAFVQAEVDSVESASPYMFNLSIRSTWGICGLHANGAKASGFKSMVCAQYTGVSLQKDDRAFIRYDRFTNTWNQASVVDAFATIPYHTKGDAYWKDDWRNFHIRASNDSFVQCVSIFAVGFADHFLMESGGDMSITNSNSNFGNTSLHAIGFKGYSFNQDKGGYITDIIPPKSLIESSANEDTIDYYTWDVQASRGNPTKLYYAGTGVQDPKKRPAATIDGFRIGAKSKEKIFVELATYANNSGRQTPPDAIYNATLSPSGFISYPSSMQILNPTTVVVNNKNQDAANRIEDNKDLIAEEAYGYITEKYPALLTKNITITKCKRDIGYILDAIIADLRLGGNINTVQAGESYFSSGALNYIDGEKFETIEGFEYARDLAIAAMRNWDFLQTGCSVTNGSEYVTVPTTVGLAIGMKVEEYTTINSNNTTVDPSSLTTANIPSNTYIKRIIDATTIELGGVVGSVRSKLNTGIAVNATGTNSAAKLLFKLEDNNGARLGVWSSTVGTVDTTITQDTVYPECDATASAITTFFTSIKTIINNGLNPVTDRHLEAHDLLLDNKNWIADVALKDMLIQYPTFTIPGQYSDWFDKYVDAVEAIAYNVKYGSNNQVWDIANINVTASVYSGEEEQAVYAFDKAKEIAADVIQNIVYTPRSGVTTTYSQVRDLTILNPSGTAFATVLTDQAALFDILEYSIDLAGTVYGVNAGQWNNVTKSTPQQTVIARISPSTNSSQFANRATLFTINAGGSNPHLFETGTAVRLVARAKSGRTPDERDIRLPIGFQPNRKYYVIAPGRNTQPFNYNQSTVYSGIFDGRDQTKLMLANTKENAAAGIYIYSPETESISDDVEIVVEQYVLDDTYDLHEYRVTFDGSSGTRLKTDVSHIFDKPVTGIPQATLQKVFFRAEGSDGRTGTLPTISGGAQIVGTTEYFIRYETEDTFRIFETATDAIQGSNEITLVNNSTQFWYVFANKRQSPMRFDPTFVDTSQSRVPPIPAGLWFLNLKDESGLDSNIHARFNQTDYNASSGQIQTTDSFYTRLKDERTPEDRIYRLRYVQPKDYPGAIRKPNNGFVIKIRTDEKRNLLPQNIILEPIGGSPSIADFRNPNTQNSTETLGMSTSAFEAEVQAGNLSKANQYDPDVNPVIVNTDNYIRFSIRSARQKLVGASTYLEVTAFDHTVDDTNAPNLRNTIFHTVEISSPQAGSFTTSNTSSTVSNRVEWTGGSSGYGHIHAKFSVGTKHYIILKDVSARPTYDPQTTTTFTQGAVYATQQADVNDGRDSTDNYLYVVGGANVFTITPGDTVRDSVGNSYKIISVSDVPDVDDTFYIFDAEEIQERVADQQDGIYYLTAVRGNITPLPRGAGVGNNFQNFRFSQPISSLYPLNYKNDPTWYQVTNNDGDKDTLITDPKPTSSFADNYTHGLVYVNDYKRSMTKEAVIDITESAYFEDYTYTGANEIKGQEGNATSGSEQRKIPIAGDASSVHDQKVYVELRRPSIARSGNHTFEYLGFGPGNYSTGLPARQEVILTEFQDYYAQAKRQDGGIVFYTGLNSNGDLYIGNRKIDAITGEEEFLERAVLAESEDDSDPITNLITTFETPVTFKDKITVEGIANLNNQLIVNCVPPDESPAVIIRSNTRDDGGSEDPTLTRGNFQNNNDGDITLDRNKISAAVFETKGRGTTLNVGQKYTQRTHFSQSENIPTNRVPDQSSTFSSDQYVRYYQSSAGDTEASPQAGDILLKGDNVGKSGSAGWILANYFDIIPTTSVLDVTTFGTTKVRIRWSGVLENSSAGINLSVGNTIRVSEFIEPNINGRWVITKADQTGNDANFVEFDVAQNIAATTYNWNVSGGGGTGTTSQTITGATFTSVSTNGTVLTTGTNADISMIGNYSSGVTYTNAQNKNPSVSWDFNTSTFPAGVTVAYYSILLEDLSTLDANTNNPVVHWSVSNIPASTNTIPANATTIAGATINNSYLGAVNTDGVSAVGYSGPQPPTNENHVYRLSVTAQLSGSNTAIITQGIQFNFDTANTVSTTSYNTVAPDNLSITYTIGGGGGGAPVLEKSNEKWKEYGLIGGEVLRTDSELIGEYKLGVNTIARTTHASHEYGFDSYTQGLTTYDEQEPRANLDVVGTAFISGKTISNANYLASSSTSKIETTVHEAFMVGGAYNNSQANALFRVDTEDTRVGINVSRAELTDTLTVQGSFRLLGSSADMDLDGDLNIDGGDLTTNLTTFNLLSTNALTVNAFDVATTLNIADSAVNAQTINIGTSVTQPATLNIHTDASESRIDIGTVDNGATNVSVITFGGAFDNTANSVFTIRNAQTILDGDLEVNGGDIESDAAVLNIFTRAGAGATANLLTRASQIQLGGPAGFTEVNNSLRVMGDTDMFGDVTMHGGANSGTVTVTRAVLNTNKQSHSAGSLTDLNVDYYKYVPDIDGAEIITSINATDGKISVADLYFLNGNVVNFTDVTGLSGVNTTTNYFVRDVDTTNNTFRVSTTAGGNHVGITGTPGVNTAVTLQATKVDTGTGTTIWTSNSADSEYTQLPVNNIEGIAIGDILLINSEMVKVVSPGPDATTRLVPVERGADCTTVSQHQDNDVIYKLEKSVDATYLTGAVPQNSTTPALRAFTDTTDTLEVDLNALSQGVAVTFSAVGSLTGIATTETYFVINVVNDTGTNRTRFQLGLTPDGGPVTLGGSLGSAAITYSDTILSLAEFGGSFAVGDYLRLSATASCPSGEFVKITVVNDTAAELFTINNGATQPADRFVVNSVYGDVDSTLIGTADFTVNLTGNAASNPSDNQFRIVNGQPNANARLVVSSDGQVDFVASGTETNPKARIDEDGNQWLAGNLRITLDSNDVPSVDDAEMALYINGSNGNTEIAGSLSIDDDFNVYSGTTGVQFGAASTSKFQVDAQTGDTRIGVSGSALGDGDLTVNGGHVNIVSTSTASPSATDYALNITNLGESANRNYRIRQDAAIDAFGQTQFYNKNGGRKWLFKNGNTTCVSGCNYAVALTATTVFTLPDTAETGDIIRFVEVTGNLSYDVSLIVRAPTGTSINGDGTGTRAGNLATAYAGGELIVQTRNAGFGLVYLGAEDGDGTAIGATYRGWWLIDI